ncbi:DNA topoisomerase VI subunit A [compost metagenome]
MQLVREDWKLFRSMETLCQKAGVHKEFIPQLVIKELVDNALDAAGDCNLRLIDDYTFEVSDQGPGINVNWIHQYFSINRPMISSKLLRLPMRGALGNGLRVVTGAVVSTGGYIQVETNGALYSVRPLEDGTSSVDKIGISNHMVGTKVRVTLGIRIRESDLNWGKTAISFSRDGKYYKGLSNPHWYTSEAFFELADAASIPIAPLFIPDSTDTSIPKTFEESEQLLKRLRSQIEPVNPIVLGEVADKFSSYYHAKSVGEFSIASSKGQHHASLPVVVESFVRLADRRNSTMTICVNKSPVTAETRISTTMATTTIYGGGLYLELKTKPIECFINIITPYMPITSDGKAPDLRPMSDIIEKSIRKAVSKARKAARDEASLNRTEKQIIWDSVEAAAHKASGGGKFGFSLRQLYYGIRPYIMEAFDGKETNYTYFSNVISKYEAEYGDIPGMYRDPRGTLYHPHSGESIPLGTLAVQRYVRPQWTFNKIIFIEKEGFFEALKDVNFPERYDCALLSSKGFASRAVKDLFDLLGETDEEIQFFCVHDADAAGTKIYEALQEETIARPGRKVKIINLGLEPEEALEMGLEVETFNSKDKRPVADYVDYYWTEWLQSNRVELNSMTTPQFISWLEGKMEEYGVGKIIPDEETLEEQLRIEVKKNIEANIRQQILESAGYSQIVKQELLKKEQEIQNVASMLQKEVEDDLLDENNQLWTKSVSNIANRLV